MVITGMSLCQKKYTGSNTKFTILILPEPAFRSYPDHQSLMTYREQRGLTGICVYLEV
jgi:hypothetical protein